MVEKTVISQLVDGVAENTPDRLAITYQDQTASYHDIFETVRCLAGHWQGLGLQGERLAIHLPNSLELTYCYLSCFKSGVTAVPINYQLKAAEMAYILSDTEAKCLVIHADKLAELESIDLSHLKLEKIIVVGAKAVSDNNFEVLLTQPSHFSAVDIKSQTYVAIFYTSGSTGKPKGVIHSHQTVDCLLDNFIDGLHLNAESIFLVTETISNISGFIHVLCSLKVAAQVVLLKAFTVDAFFKAMTLYHPTVFTMFTTRYREIVNDPRVNHDDFKQVAIASVGGDKVPLELLEAFFDKTGIELQQGYGMTETVHITKNWRTPKNKWGSIGKPALNTEIRLVDSNGKDVAIGDIGEIWVKAPSVMVGYWKKPEEMKKTMVEGWLRTGDLARCDQDGYYWFEGRSKNIIGHLYGLFSPYEVEEVLSQHSAVKAVGVVGIKHPKFIEVAHAYVVLKPGCSASEKELLNFTRERLSDFKVPDKIYFLEQLPKTSTGKIDRKRLSGG